MMPNVFGSLEGELSEKANLGNEELMLPYV
jgi:hypothetical protein